MDNFQLVVGSTECPINTVALTIRSSTVMNNEWSTLAMGLNVGSEHIKKFRQDLLFNKTYLDIILEVLELWVGNNGSSATLGKLLHVVEGACGANDAGESLRLHFYLPCKTVEFNSSIDWYDIPPSFQKRITETFQKFFPTLKFSNTLPNLKNPALIKLMTGKKPPVFVHPFPETLRYYITRTLITRNIISEQIFDQDSQDIFLFIGLDPSELSALAGKNLTGTSTTLLRYSSPVNFVILDRAHHFDKICKKIGHPVHLLRKEDDKRLRWIRSSGGMDNLQKCVDQVQDEFDEEKFCRHMESGVTPVVICDSPGMGKSVLLAQIGAALGQVHPDRTVLFVAFTEFIKQIKSIEINDEVKMIKVALKELTGEKVVHSDTEETIVTFELLLDGFDELDSVDYKLAHSILKHITTSFNSTRLWVTSRPHQMNKLETSLNVLGYNIRPFDQQDQVQFLSSFWSRKVKVDKVRSRLFARKCLKSLKSKMDSTSQDIAGIPLQCLLIGEVYEDDAKEYARVCNNDAAPVIFDIGTITELYQRLIKNKIEKYKSLNGRFGEDELMDIHARLSTELIFPGKTEALELEPTPDESGIAELLKVGIIVKSSGSYAFLHRTFAEYFVAWFVLNRLGREEEWTGGMNRFFLHSVLECRDTKYYDSTEFVYPVICYFLNSSIADLTAGDNPPHICTQLDTESPRLMRTFAIACVRSDLEHIFKLFHNRYESDVFTKRFLRHSIEYSSLELVKPVVSQLERRNRFSMEVLGEALSTAVRFGKFPIVEFLIKEKQACGIVEDLNYYGTTGGLVHLCIQYSVNNSAKEAETRIQVLRLLVRINGSLLNAKVNGSQPLLFQGVHVKLRIELVRLGAYVLAEDKHNNILHITDARKLSSSDYQTLLMSIPDENLRELVHKKGWDRRTPLSSALQYIDPTSETLDMFHRVGADFNHTDSKGLSVLEVAIRRRRSVVTIRKIIQHGDIKVLGQANPVPNTQLSPPHQSTNLLHTAAEWGNVEAVGVFADEYGIDVNSKDERGRTPLDRLIESDEYGDRFATGLALKNRGGRVLDDNSLIVAAASRNEQSVRLLISFGVDVNGSDKNGDTALHKAVGLKLGYSRHEFTIVQLLVDSGADVTALNKLGNIPLHTAMENEKLDFNTFLLLKSKTDECSRMTPAACNFQLKLALRRGNDRLYEKQFISILNNFSEIHQQNVGLIENDGEFAVHVAARRGHLKALQLLVEKGANVNLKNKRGETPLHLVARYRPNGYMIMVKYLLGRADAVAKDNEDRTFLHRFILESPSPSAFHLMVECLIEAGVPNLFNVSGGGCGVNKENCRAFPLQLAVRYLEPEINTLELFQPHVDFNAVDQLGHSILVNAVQGDRGLKFILTLVNRLNLDWRIIDKEGCSILHYAAIAEYGSLDRLKFFLELGGLDVNKLNNEGETPLFRAVKRTDVLEKCKLLVAHGTDIKKKFSFLNHAEIAQFESPDCLKFFLELGGLDMNEFNDEGETAVFCAVKSREEVLEKCKLLVAHGADVNIPNKAGVTPLALVELMRYWDDEYDLVELLRT